MYGISEVEMNPQIKYRVIVNSLIVRACSIALKKQPPTFLRFQVIGRINVAFNIYYLNEVASTPHIHPHVIYTLGP